MKQRTWILVLLLLVTAGIFSSNAIINHYGLDTRFHKRINEIVSESLGGEFESSSVYILPWSFGVKDARFRLSNFPIQVQAKRIRIEFNIWKIIANKFRLSSGAGNILFDNPLLTFNMSDSNQDSTQTNSNKLPEIQLENIPTIRIVIVNGAFAVAREDSSFVIAKHIDGWLDAKSLENITLEVEGRMLSGFKNTACSAKIKRDASSYSLSFSSKDCTLSSDRLSLITGDILPRGGIFDISYTRTLEKDVVTQNGSFSARDTDFEIKETGIRVNDLSVTGSITNDEILFDTVTATLWGMHPELTGKLSLENKPRLSLSINAKAIDIETLLSELVPDHEKYPSGLVNVSASIVGPLNGLTATIEAESDSLFYESYRLDKNKLTAEFKDGNVEVRKFISNYKSLEFKGQANSSSVMSLETDKNFSIQVDTTDIVRKQKILTIDVKGKASLEQASYSAQFDLGIPLGSGKTPPIRKLQGNFKLRDNFINYTAKNKFVSLEGSLENIFKKLSLKTRLNFNEFPIMSFFGVPDTTFVLTGANLINGNLSDISIDSSIAFSVGKYLNSRFEGKILAENIFSETASVGLDGSLSDHRILYSKPLNWKLNLRADRQRSYTQIIDPDGLLLSLSADHKSGKLHGDLELNELPLEWIIDIFRRSEFAEKAKLSGRAQIGGTINNPEFHTLEKVRAEEMTVGGLSRLTGTGHVRGDFSELVFHDFDIQRKGLQILHSDSRWERGKPYIFKAEGDSVSLSAIDDLISPIRLTDGTTNYSFTMDFTRKHADITGNFSIENGHFYDIPFTRTSGTMSGGSDGFLVSDFTVLRDKVFIGRGTASSGFFWKNKLENPGLKMDLLFEGDLLKVLPPLTSGIKDASGQSQLMLSLGGTWTDPIVLDAELYVSGGKIKPAFLVDEITEITATLAVDQDSTTFTGLLPVSIKSASGRLLNKKIVIRNEHLTPQSDEPSSNENLLNIINSKANLDFGVLKGKVLSENQRDRSVELHIPSFMKENDSGRFEIDEREDDSFLIGAASDGDKLTPYISGSLNVLSGDIHYPLLTSKKKSGDVSFINDIFWDIKLNAGSNVNYVHEENISWRVGGTTVSKTNIKLDDNSSFTVRGRLADDSFHVTGKARSFSGTISYYGTEFDLERAEFTLDSNNSYQPAMLAARAMSIVYDDTTNTDTEIYLNVYFVDTETGYRQEASGGRGEMRSDFRTADTSSTIDAGVLGTLMIEFSSSNPTDDTIEKIFARLGISGANIVGAATDALASGMDNYYFDPLMRTFEDALKRYTHLDVVRLSPSVMKNFMRSQIGSVNRYGHESDIFLFDKSRIMVGEYLLENWFLSYRGQYGLGRDYLRRRERGFFHEIGLQYMLKHNTRFQFNYNYDEIINKSDKRFEIRYDFEF